MQTRQMGLQPALTMLNVVMITVLLSRNCNDHLHVTTLYIFLTISNINVYIVSLLI